MASYFAEASSKANQQATSSSTETVDVNQQNKEIQNLNNTSGVAETMTSDIVSENKVLCRCRDKIAVVLHPHFKPQILMLRSH